MFLIVYREILKLEKNRIDEMLNSKKFLLVIQVYIYIYVYIHIL